LILTFRSAGVPCRDQLVELSEGALPTTSASPQAHPGCDAAPVWSGLTDRQGSITFDGLCLGVYNIRLQHGYLVPVSRRPRWAVEVATSYSERSCEVRPIRICLFRVVGDEVLAVAPALGVDDVLGGGEA